MITTNVYKDILSKFKKPIQEILSSLNVENTKELEDVSNKIQSLITSIDLSKNLEKSLIKAYDKLGELVAVRSSATAEYQKEASFAGQMTTFLNVTKDEIIECVKKCIASLFTARAIYYRSQKKIDHMKVWMTLLLPKLVE